MLPVPAVASEGEGSAIQPWKYGIRWSACQKWLWISSICVKCGATCMPIWKSSPGVFFVTLTYKSFRVILLRLLKQFLFSDMSQFNSSDSICLPASMLAGVHYQWQLNGTVAVTADDLPSIHSDTSYWLAGHEHGRGSRGGRNSLVRSLRVLVTCQPVWGVRMKRVGRQLWLRPYICVL